MCDILYIYVYAYVYPINPNNAHIIEKCKRVCLRSPSFIVSCPRHQLPAALILEDDFDLQPDFASGSWGWSCGVLIWYTYTYIYIWFIQRLGNIMNYPENWKMIVGDTWKYPDNYLDISRELLIVGKWMKMMGMEDMKKQIEIETTINGDSTLKILGKKTGWVQTIPGKTNIESQLETHTSPKWFKAPGWSISSHGTLEGWSLAIDTCTVSKDMSSLGARTLAGS